MAPEQPVGHPAAEVHAGSGEECARREQRAPLARQQVMPHSWSAEVASRGTAKPRQNADSNASATSRCLNPVETRLSFRTAITIIHKKCVSSEPLSGADGRNSIVRDCSGLKVEDIGVPMDVLVAADA